MAGTSAEYIQHICRTSLRHCPLGSSAMTAHVGPGNHLTLKPHQALKLPDMGFMAFQRGYPGWVGSWALSSCSVRSSLPTPRTVGVARRACKKW